MQNSALRRRLAALAAAGLVVASGSVSAQNVVPVDLELALAVDVSGSIDDEEAILQRNGYIDAFRDPDVIAAIKSGMLRRIAVAYYEWAGFGHMKIIADWTLIESQEDAFAFAAELTKTPPQTARRTAISSAIRFGVQYFGRNRFEGTRRVIDVSGDGPNNWGGIVTLARDEAVAAGVTINGLPIVNDRPSPFGFATYTGLERYYRECVIGGPGAFLVAATDFKDFARAVRRKLILEIAGGATEGSDPRVHKAQATRELRGCDVGERLWPSNDDY